MRLDRFFAQQELASRKEVRQLVKNGAITVNGLCALSADQKVDEEKDAICLMGKQMSYKPFVYIMLNKPMGVVSATQDNLHQTVLDLVPDDLKRADLFPAGRLDKDTTGFVLLTNDGDFAHRILSPKNHVEKTYHASLSMPVTQAQIEQFALGMILPSGEECKPAILRELEMSHEKETFWAEIVLCEGKYHQIKRMFEAVGNHVVTLKRVKMGELSLFGDLPEGACRELSLEQLSKIDESCLKKGN